MVTTVPFPMEKHGDKQKRESYNGKHKIRKSRYAT